MTRPVEITLPERTFVCDENGKATVIFTISNISDEKLELATSLSFEDDTETPMQQDWFDIKVDPDWTLDSKATEQLTVNIQIPDKQPLGDYKFKLTVYSKDNPGDDFSTSEMVCVKKQQVVVPEVTDKKFPWWIVAVAVLLVIVAGVGWYYSTTTELPDVTGQDLQSAQKLLEDKDFIVTLKRAPVSWAVAKQKHYKNSEVIEQVPDAKETSRVKKGSEITLKIVSILSRPEPGNKYVILPDVRTQKLLAALQKLNKAGLEVDLSKIKKKYNKNFPEDTVIEQLPDPSRTRRVRKGTKIILTISTKTLIAKPMVLTAPQIKVYKTLQFRNIETGDHSDNK